MKRAHNEDELAALSQWVVVRTASAQVRERGHDGRWYAMGVAWPEHQVTWTEEDFPATVLWSYAEELNPPALPLPPIPPIGTSPYTTLQQVPGQLS